VFSGSKNICWNGAPSRSGTTTPLFVCLFVCQMNNTESYELILMKFCGEVGHGPKRNLLDFDGDPESFVDSESKSRISHIRK